MNESTPQAINRLVRISHVDNRSEVIEFSPISFDTYIFVFFDVNEFKLRTVCASVIIDWQWVY